MDKKEGHVTSLLFVMAAAFSRSARTACGVWPSCPCLPHRCILILRWDTQQCAACHAVVSSIQQFAARDGGVTSRNVSTEPGLTEEDRHDLIESPGWQACQPASSENACGDRSTRSEDSHARWRRP